MAVALGVASLGFAAYQYIDADKKEKKANEAINNFNRQELVNPYENIQLSTVQSDQQTEANNINFATSVDALQRGGATAVLGGMPRLNQQNILMQQQIARDLENQDKERQYAIAQGEEQIRAIGEGRETRALAGYGNLLQTARQDKVNAIGNGIQSGLSLGVAIDEKIQENKGQSNGNDPFSGTNFNFNSIGFVPTIKGL